MTSLDKGAGDGDDLDANIWLLDIAGDSLGEPMWSALPVRRIGNSLGIVFPEAMLCRIEAREGDAFTATVTEAGEVMLTLRHPFTGGQRA
jgi:hypothetical protein